MTYSTFLHSGIINPKATKTMESSDPVDTVTLDIPLLIRLLELSREDIKSDAELHDVVTNILKLKNQGTLTMQDYDKILLKSEKTELESIRKLAGI